MLLFRNITMILSRPMGAVMFFGLMAYLLFSHPTWAQSGVTDVIAAPDARAEHGATVTYVLPAEGELPRTYRVTLAIVDPKNADWIVSTFVAGAPRTVTKENKGRFTETWDGLDDNFMPVPPGTYGLKGIFMPANKWQVDGEYHSITPQFVTGISPWMPTPAQWNKPEPLCGDPGDNASVADIDVGLNGIAVFYYHYLEIISNNAMIDLNRPIGYEQFLRAFSSGGAAGGSSTCTDGETIWSFSTDGGPKFIYRADQKPFGNSAGTNRRGVTLVEGFVESMAAYRDLATGKSTVYVAEGRRLMPNGNEPNSEFVDKVTVFDGNDAKPLAVIPVRRPKSVVARYGTLHILHQTDAGGYVVSSVPLAAGRPQGAPRRLFAVPATIVPFDLEEDSHGRFYLSDPKVNKVYQLDAAGKMLRTFGRLDVQTPGSYDPQTLMSPGKLATWKDEEGKDRLLIVDQAGPQATSEWSADGRLLRQFMSLQTRANNYGYTIDPEHPEDLYIGGHQDWLTRFKMDYAKGTWKVDAVWPEIGSDPLAPSLDHPRFINLNGKKYLACGRNQVIYRQAGDRWLLSAAIIRQQTGGKRQHYAWHDANGDGRVQEAEYREAPLTLPGAVLRYWGEQWLDDLSLLAMNQAGRDLWLLKPTGFDAHGNPIFKEFAKLLTDPVLQARADQKADAVHGGNEMSDIFLSDWAMATMTAKDGVYVIARGGPNHGANFGGQEKLSHYEPDGKGGFALQWRSGRQALGGVAQPGEIYGAIYPQNPINGIVSLIDNSRCGVLLYTDDGLYVESLFPDARRFPPFVAGIYPREGEFFSGFVYPNRDDGSIYLGMGKHTPLIFRAQGWSLKENPVRRLTTLAKTVTITATEIAAPPEIALAMRGGPGAARLARFAPALGGAVLDGSMSGWESCDPIAFQADKEQTVEVRMLYDPENLYFRWQARLSTPFDPKPLAPAEHLFDHGRLADTLSFYMQGDVNAPAGGSVDGRPGDVRIIFSVLKDGEAVRPVALGMYPTWKGSAKPTPMTYQSPVSKVRFAHVGLLTDVRLKHVVDADGKGFVLTAAVPRSVFPGLPAFSDRLRTMVNFEATFLGHSKFWWANSDSSASRETYDEPSESRLYPGSWAPAQFQGFAKGVTVRKWLSCGPFGGPGAEKFEFDPRNEMKNAVREFCEAATFPPDDGRVDLKATFTGEMIKGYWNDPRAVRWSPASIADLDTRFIVGGGGQVWYGATWIWVPEETALEFQFQSHFQTYLRWFLNGQPVDPGKYVSRLPENAAGTVATKTIVLPAGWNQITFRGYGTGYSPFRVGLVLNGDPARLWSLKLSATPPPVAK